MKQTRRGGDKPRERLIDLFSKSRRKEDPKAWFLDQLSEGGFDPDLASVFKSREPSTYVTKASRWYMWMEERASENPPVKPAKSLEQDYTLDSKNQWERIKAVSPSLYDAPYNRKDVSTNDGRGPAVVLECPPIFIAGGTSDEDVERLFSVIRSGESAGVVSTMPSSQDIIAPWQRELPNRSGLIMPPGAEKLADKGYAYVGKGMWFNPKRISDFSLHAVRGAIFGEKDVVFGTQGMTFVEDGTSASTEPPRSIWGGLAFPRAERQHLMMLLGIKRGVRDYVWIDSPQVYGLYPDVKASDGTPQGFTIVKILHEDVRGDRMISRINKVALAKLLGSSPRRKEYIDGVLVGIKEMRRKTQDGLFQHFIDDGAASEDDTQKFLRNLGNVEKFISEKGMVSGSEDELVRWITNLEQCYVETPGKELLFESADEVFMTGWRRESEMVPYVNGVMTRVLVEHAIANEQPHFGNSRIVVEEDATTLGACDWEQTNDMAPMTYPQALGEVSRTLFSLLTSSWRGQKGSIQDVIGCDLASASLNGFLLEDARLPEFMREADPHDVRAVTKLMQTEVPDEDIRRGISPMHGVLHVTGRKPATEIDHPFFRLAQQVYPEERHLQLQEKFGVRDESH